MNSLCKGFIRLKELHATRLELDRFAGGQVLDTTTSALWGVGLGPQMYILVSMHLGPICKEGINPPRVLVAQTVICAATTSLSIGPAGSSTQQTSSPC